MKKNLLVLVILGIFIPGLCLDALAQKEITEEELLFMEIPVVFASSKRLQPITEAASSVEIITAEDIKRSGAISIANVLRKVAGIHVKEPSASSHAIGIRGFPYTQHVLITVDGNSAYLHHVNHTYVDFIPMDLEEIERIEIVKGPGAVFYGGSAFSGVINIVTKTPKQIDGTQVNIVGGNWDTFRGNVIHGGSYKNLDYSASVGYRRTKYMSPPRESFMKSHTYSNYFAGKAVYHFGEESSLSTAVRYGQSDDAISRSCTPENTYISLRFDKPNTWIRCFYNNQYKECFNNSIHADDTNYELEIMHILKWSKNSIYLVL